MHDQWYQRGIPAVLLIASLGFAVPAIAAPSTKERLPLTMTGSGCTGKEAEMTTILQAIPGVIGVDFNRVPDHVLVDITTGTTNAQDVINQVNHAARAWQCKVEFIEGCISAKMPSASATPHHPE
jgi:hypothetical protein